MRQWLRRHLTYANVMVTILGFIVLTGGTAVALNGVDTVQSDDLGPGAQVKAPDVAANAVNGSDVVDNSITGADVNESTLALGGQLAGFFEAEDALGGCDDDGETGEICANITGITLARSGQLLLNASSPWYTYALDDTVGPSSGTDDPGRVIGNCMLRVDGTPIGAPTIMGERSESTVPNHPGDAPGTMALTALSSVLAAGPHTADVFCTEVDGNIEWPGFNLTAARVDN